MSYNKKNRFARQVKCLNESISFPKTYTKVNLCMAEKDGTCVIRYPFRFLNSVKYPEEPFLRCLFSERFDFAH